MKKTFAINVASELFMLAIAGMTAFIFLSPDTNILGILLAALIIYIFSLLISMLVTAIFTWPVKKYRAWKENRHE